MTNFFVSKSIAEGMELNIGKRLEAIANFVDKGSRVADVGTDHGYIPVYLVKKGYSSFVVASDINKGPLEKAISFVRLNGLEKNIETRLGGGLSVLEPGEVDEVIIAGMGGVLMANIIEASLDVARSARKLILQPMQAPDELRRYLLDGGFEITREALVKEEGKVYEIMEVRYTDVRSYEDDEIYFEVGRRLLDSHDPLLAEFIDRKIKKYEDIVISIEGKKTQKAQERREYCISKIERLKELRKHALEGNN